MTTLTWAALVSTLLSPMAWPLPFRVWPQDPGLGLAHIVRIGFLNETDPARVAALEPQYRQKFDAIILGDGSFEWLFDLLPA